MYTDKTVAYYTLGCRLNFAESSTLAYRLQQMGFTRVKTGGSDLVVVNTCAVTEQATAKCRQQIRKLIRENPGAFVMVTGCYAQIDPQALISQVEGIDLIVGTEYKGEDITSYLGDLSKNSEPKVISTRFQEIHTFHASCSADDRTRHFLKVQDGCDYFCTYCTIPMARGRSRNPHIADLVASAGNVAQHGGKEIVLTGVNIGDFGRSTGEDFFSLCRALDDVEGIERYRIGSIEPNLLTDELLHWIANESKRFAPHFHIPLQAGSDEVLRLMRRRYDTALFRRKIELVRQLLPDAFIGVDVMAGMRGETPELFEQSYSFLDSLPVSQLHPFTYSERTGTRALEIKPIVPMPERHERTARLVELSERKLRDFYASQLGSSRRVIWEEVTAGRKGRQQPMHGFTENYIRIETECNPALFNTCQTLTLDGSIGESTQGLVIKIR
ncbi:MAG: MiaB/RimO family radical SAM methylthiotransferase [Bacteroidales bacterium]|nr:MiaB/RimO family radical SAM methylthiotransferase [Candidatus Liminaster caballi]